MDRTDKREIPGLSLVRGGQADRNDQASFGSWGPRRMRPVTSSQVEIPDDLLRLLVTCSEHRGVHLFEFLVEQGAAYLEGAELTIEKIAEESVGAFLQGKEEVEAPY